MQNLTFKFISPVIATITTLVAVSVSVAQSDTQVVWKWEQGDQFAVGLQQETIVATKVDKRIRQVDNLTMLDFAWEVSGVNEEGDATIKQSIKRIRIKTGPPGVSSKTTIDFDTDIKKTQTGLSKSLRKQALPLIDVEFTTTISQFGEVKNVAYSDETMELLRALPASTQIRKIFTKDGLQNLYGSAMIVLPATTPGAGESWTIAKTVEHPVTKFNRSSEYTFTGLEGSKAKFTVTSHVTESKQDSETVAIEPKPVVSIKLTNFTGDGEFTFDNKEGCLLESEVRSELATAATYQDKAMNTTVSTTTAMKVNKK